MDLQEGSDDEKLAVRQAAAQLIDRQSIADNVYNGTATPLYSMIPNDYPFHTDAFADEYGEEPESRRHTDAGGRWGRYPGAARGLVDADPLRACIRRRVRRDPASAQRLGLFDVTLKSTEWNQYSEAAFTDKYPAYQLGWFPDYPDADNYTSTVLLDGQLPQHPLLEPGDG